MEMRDQNANLKNRLKQESYQATENPWFKANVMHRLPERHRPWRVWVLLFYALAVLACGWSWYYVIDNVNLQVITVRDLLQGSILLIGTAVLLWQCVVAVNDAQQV